MNDELPPGEEPPKGPGEEFYAEQFDRLTEIAVREHALERDAAEELARDILLGFMSRAGRSPGPGVRAFFFSLRLRRTAEASRVAGS